jgi:hypothetical protein
MAAAGGGTAMLDAALAQIEVGNRRLFDPAAVDVSIALFRQKGCAFQ